LLVVSSPDFTSEGRLEQAFGGSSDGFGGTAPGSLPGGGTSGVENAYLSYTGLKPFRARWREQLDSGENVRRARIGVLGKFLGESQNSPA
jgi:hypothetical protein